MRFRSAFVLAALLLTPTSAVSGQQSKSASRSEFVAPPDAALVVVVRPRYYPKGLRVRVTDLEQTRCLGTVKGKEHTTFTLEPGTHSLVVGYSKKIKRVDLTVEGGRTYVLRAEAYGGKAVVRVMPAKRRTTSVEEVNAWLGDSKVSMMDLERCTQAVQRDREQRRRRQGMKTEEEQRESDSYRAWHSLHASDGWTAQEASFFSAKDRSDWH